MYHVRILGLHIIYKSSLFSVRMFTSGSRLLLSTFYATSHFTKTAPNWGTEQMLDKHASSHPLNLFKLVSSFPCPAHHSLRHPCFCTPNLEEIRIKKPWVVIYFFRLAEYSYTSVNEVEFWWKNLIIRNLPGHTIEETQESTRGQEPPTWLSGYCRLRWAVTALFPEGQGGGGRSAQWPQLPYDQRTTLPVSQETGTRHAW